MEGAIEVVVQVQKVQKRGSPQARTVCGCVCVRERERERVKVETKYVCRVYIW